MSLITLENVRKVYQLGETEVEALRGSDVEIQEDLISSFNDILTIVTGVVIGITSSSHIVGAVNIMNTMYTSVTQRT